MRFSLVFLIVWILGVADARPIGKTYRGQATWFVPSVNGGSMGACGEYEGDNDYVVAMVIYATRQVAAGRLFY